MSKMRLPWWETYGMGNKEENTLPANPVLAFKTDLPIIKRFENVRYNVNRKIHGPSIADHRVILETNF